MRILVCGDREWTDADAIYRVLSEYQGTRHVVIHGAARGADRLAGDIADYLGMTVEAYPADWDRYGKAAGPIRNQAMLDTRPDLVIAFHADLARSRGTADMVRRAKAAGVPVRHETG